MGGDFKDLTADLFENLSPLTQWFELRQLWVSLANRSL